MTFHTTIYDIKHALLTLAEVKNIVRNLSILLPRTIMVMVVRLIDVKMREILICLGMIVQLNGAV